MKILLAAGGTAGHINPAISIADLLGRELADAEIVFVGTPSGMENRLVTEAGYSIRHVDVTGFKRRLTVANLGTLWKALQAGKAAKAILREEMPSLVIGTGGYVCYPILKMASKMGIPTAIHESNARAGLTVRLLARHVSTVMLGLPSAKQSLKSARRTVVTGNPIRAEFHRLTREDARSSLHLKRDDLLLLSFGGSLGANTINQAMREAIPILLKKHPRLHIVHATGADHYTEFSQEINGYLTAEAKRIDIRPYISDIPRLMLAADLLLSRSGAMTLSEAAFTGTPAILVPYPYATDDHQTKNALSLAESGGAAVIRDAELTGESLSKEVSRLLSDGQARRHMRQMMYRFAPRDAEARILNELRSLLSSSAVDQSALR